MPLLSIALTQFTKKMPICICHGRRACTFSGGGDGSIKKVF